MTPVPFLRIGKRSSLDPRPWIKTSASQIKVFIADLDHGRLVPKMEVQRTRNGTLLRLLSLRAHDLDLVRTPGTELDHEAPATRSAPYLTLGQDQDLGPLDPSPELGLGLGQPLTRATVPILVPDPDHDRGPDHTLGLDPFRLATGTRPIKDPRKIHSETRHASHGTRLTISRRTVAPGSP